MLMNTHVLSRIVIITIIIIEIPIYDVIEKIAICKNHIALTAFDTVRRTPELTTCEFSNRAQVL